MNRKLFNTIAFSYLFFLLASFLAVPLLVPPLLEHYLYDLARDEQYRAFLISQSISLQDTCYVIIALIYLLSLIPAAVFYLRLYRPLSRISESASRYMNDQPYEPFSYEKDDELGRVTATLRYLAEAADESSDYQRKFISNISHDFRSPLTSIKGYIEAILDGTIPPELQERYLRIVLDETKRLNHLSDSLLLLNTFDDHRIHLEITVFDICEILRHTADSFEGTCQKKHLSLRTELPPYPLPVQADVGRIQQVLYNLLDNAIKFSPPGKEIILRASEQNRRICVSVKDFGTGIAKEQLPKIWDRFYKTDASRGRDKKGTGLGLSIVKEIIRAHGQNIDVVSTEGVGTEFIFTLASPDAAGKNGHGVTVHGYPVNSNVRGLI